MAEPVRSSGRQPLSKRAKKQTKTRHRDDTFADRTTIHEHNALEGRTEPWAVARMAAEEE